MSVVIATYNRPTLLMRAIQSIELQTLQPSEILVVGDNCSPETRQALSEYRGSLCIKFVNLSFRCGEQSIPNKIGSELACSKSVAFLNQDDVWLPNHLEISTQVMKITGSNWFVGRAAFFENLKESNGILQSTGTSSTRKEIGKAYRGPDNYFEPSSSWVVTRSALDVVPWKPASTTIRTPLADLALRMCLRFGEPGVFEQPTVLKVMGPNKSKPQYSGESEVSHRISQLVAGMDLKWPFGISVDAPVSEHRNRPRYQGHSGIHAIATRCLSSRIAFFVFRVFGFDSLARYSAILTGGNQKIFSTLLKTRTGEDFTQNVTELQKIDSSQLSPEYFGKHQRCQCP